MEGPSRRLKYIQCKIYVLGTKRHRHSTNAHKCRDKLLKAIFLTRTVRNSFSYNKSQNKQNTSSTIHANEILYSYPQQMSQFIAEYQLARTHLHTLLLHLQIVLAGSGFPNTRGNSSNCSEKPCASSMPFIDS